jgi:hypothetical protein
VLNILEGGLEALLNILEEGLEELTSTSERTLDAGRERLGLRPHLNPLIVSSKSPFVASDSDSKLDAKLGTSEGRRAVYDSK